MGRASLLACACAAALIAFMACSGDRFLRHPAKSSLLTDSAPLAAYPSPARWRYHPRAAAPLLARLALKDGSTLFAGERGERWLSSAGAHGPLAAAQFAPEELVSILRAGEAWIFVGASGTGYEALEPLGPFVRSSAPVEPLARISAAGITIAGVRRDGRLVRSADAGASWQEVGPEQPRFADVVLTGGTGLALSVPERLWATQDEGATWKPIDIPPAGVVGLAVDSRAGALVRTLFGAHRLTSGTSPSLERLGRSIEPEQHELGGALPRGPDAEAVAAGRAFFDDGRYYEAAEREKGKGFVLWSGPSDGPLQPRPIERADGCREVRLAGFDRHLVLGCARRTTSRIGQTLELYASNDGGRDFAAEPYAVEGRLAELGLAVGKDGTLLVTGTCAPHAATTGCSPAGVHRIDLRAKPSRRDRKSPKTQPSSLVPAATPALDGSALALAFSADGARAYLVGRRTKDGGLSLFVSHDAGKSFEAREIEGLGSAESSADETFRGTPEPDTAFEVESLTAAEDGAVALVIKGGESRLLVVADEDGRIVAVSHPPDAAALMGAAGSRALAIVARTQSVWESTDGGASWEALGRLPLDPCPERSRCDVSVRCHTGGCVVGGVLSRLGWHGQADEDQTLLPPPDARVADVADRKLRPGISCSLEEGSWRALSGVSRAPTAREAAIGKSTWYSVATDDGRAAAWMLSVTAGERGSVETTTLLAPATRPETYAYHVSLQIEGAAALRYVIPEARPGETRLLNLEIAWQNFFEGRLGRARLADAGPYQPGDYKKGEGAAQLARPDLLSIASGGVYVRLHPAAKAAQPTLFFGGRSVQRVPPVDWPALELGQVRADMVHVGASHIPLLLVGNGVAMVRARRHTSGWSFDAFTTGLPQPDAFGLDQTQEIAYVAGRPGLHLQEVDSNSGAGRGWLQPFRADGAALDPPLPVPTQLDSAERPVRCTPEQIQKTPRVVAPFQPGTRHPVIVADAVEPLRVMLTGAAVLHGTRDSACIAAFDAQTVIEDPHVTNERAQAILPIAELERSWLFRLAPDSDSDDPRIEARAMKCRFEPSLEVPPEVYEAPGTSVKRSRR